jgi:hypothetical protein
MQDHSQPAIGFGISRIFSGASKGFLDLLANGRIEGDEYRLGKARELR